MNDKYPLISVLIPVYNARKFLSSCLDSVCSQTYTNIEILCVDDGSTDDSYSILKKYAQNDSRIKIIQSTAHQGIAGIRNLLLENASGKYIAFVDADDTISPQYLEVLYVEAAQHNADIVRGLYYLWNTRTNQKIPCDKCYRGFLRKEIGFKPIDRLQMALDDTQVWLKLIKSSLIEKNHLSFLKGFLAEDLSFGILLYQYADKICFIPQYLYMYRVGSLQSLSSQKYLCAYGTLENLIFVAQELAKRQKTDSALFSRIVLLIFHAIRRLRKFSLPERKKAVGVLSRKGFVVIEQSLAYTSWLVRMRSQVLCWVAHRVPDQYLPYVAYWMR